MARTEKKGPPTVPKLLTNMSSAFSQQNCALVHRLGMTREWWQSHFPALLNKKWPGNSPDLSPLENMQAVVQEEVNKMAPGTSEMPGPRSVYRRWNAGPWACLYQGEVEIYLWLKRTPRVCYYHAMDAGKVWHYLWDILYKSLQATVTYLRPRPKSFWRIFWHCMELGDLTRWV